MGAARKTCQVSDQLPQDQRQVDSVRGEVRVQVRRGGVNRLRLLRDQGGAALVGEQDVGQGVGPVALRGIDIRAVELQRQAGLPGLKKFCRLWDGRGSL